MHALPEEPAAEPCLPVRSKANAILGKAEQDTDVPNPVVTIAIVAGRSLAWAVLELVLRRAADLSPAKHVSSIASLYLVTL